MLHGFHFSKPVFWSTLVSMYWNFRDSHIPYQWPVL